jgi:endonuclease/exonuclease/phosphatase family metal-dependent hydrolase
LQEVDAGHFSAPQGTDQAAQLARMLGMECIMGTTLSSDRGRYGNAVLTRCTVDDVRRHDLSFPGREPRGALEIAMRWNGRPLRFVSTHLGLTAKERTFQVERLLSLVKPASGDPLTILAGDINEWIPGNRIISRIERAFGRTPHRLTFPSRFPFLPLDRIWVYPHGTLKSVWVHQSRASQAASDHLPLVGEVRCE